MANIPHPAPRFARGFSLIELLVGIAIGLIGVVIMMQVFSVSEERKRTTTSGSDATTAGALALYGLQHDLREAGYGLSSRQLLGCNIVLPSGATVPLVPVTINPTALVPAGDANTDTLLIIYANTNSQPEGHIILDRTGAIYTVQMPTSFAVGDLVVAAPAACTAALTPARVAANGVSATTVTLTAGAAGTTLFNLGQNPRFLAYAIRNGSLTVCDFLANNCSLNPTEAGITVAEAAARNAAWVAIASNMASLKAQYGHGIVPGGGTYDQTPPTAACGATGWIATSVVRLALAARSSQYETRVDAVSGQRVCDPVTAAAPVWDGSVGAPFNLTGNADWQCHRYKIFQTVVPLRNIAWMTTC